MIVRFIYSLYIVGILLVLVPPILLGYYPVPGLFPSPAYSHTDFYDICYYTIHKYDNYTLYQDVYPPLGHFYCLLSRVFFVNLQFSRYEGRYFLPDSIPLILLVFASIASIFFLFAGIQKRFQARLPIFIPLSAIASNPILTMFDRGNLMMVGFIACNIFIGLLLRGRLSLYLASLLQGVAVGIKPYLLAPLISMPILAINTVLSALGLNLLAYLIWQPPRINFLFFNLFGFVSSDNSLTLDIANFIWTANAWISFPAFFKLIYKIPYDNSIGIDYSTLFSIRVLLVFGLILYAFAIFISFLVLLCLLMHTYTRSRLSFARFVNISNSDLFLFISSYLLIFAIMISATKSVYWYSVSFAIPFFMVVDSVIILAITSLSAHKRNARLNNSTSITNTYFGSPDIYQFCYLLFKALFFNVLFISPPVSECYELPAYVNYFNKFLPFIGFDKFQSSSFACWVVNPIVVTYLSLRAFAFPFLCLLAIFVLYRYMPRQYSNQNNS